MALTWWELNAALNAQGLALPGRKGPLGCSRQAGPREAAPAPLRADAQQAARHCCIARCVDLQLFIPPAYSSTALFTFKGSRVLYIQRHLPPRLEGTPAASGCVYNYPGSY